MPTLAVTMGDPGGIGPEIILKALAHAGLRRQARWLLVGDQAWFERTRQRLRLPRAVLHAAGITLVDCPGQAARWAGRHHPCAASGRAAYTYLVRAVRLIQQGGADGLVTAPVAKAALAEARLPVSGHTELLARLTRTRHVAMLLSGRRLRVLLATRHLPLRRVPAALRSRDLLEDIRLLHAVLRAGFGCRHPRIAVAGVNPHAGEGGALGHEEQRIITPAIRRAQRLLGPRITGPWAADAVFYDAYRGRHDAVVCMYHDQGAVPLKMIDRDAGINVTLGLPFVRTSPDHGTAFDIAGTGRAHPGSMIAAMRFAVRWAGSARAHPR
ncbi:MAG: 4-hydroxythreonine-4-phosphate dehydrogenase PdxA [Candidatus Omnitrophica bacterium]|nr:4-hydroxythreonine-4-phosphate dehydrogenase PdxA [Candidatus Omnitrophota bacterium]